MAHSLAWRDLSNDQVVEIIKSTSVEEMKSKIEQYGMEESMFDTSGHDDRVNDCVIRQQRHIVRDLLYHIVAFALRQGMDNIKLSTLFSIMKKVHLESVGQHLSITESFNLMKKLLVDHSVHQPPYRVEIFNMLDVKNISEYVYDSYYRHFKLYQYAFCKKNEANINVRTSDEFVENVPTFLSLDSAISEEEWIAQIEAEQKKREEEEAEVKRIAEEQARREQEEKEAAEAAAAAAEAEQAAKKAKEGPKVHPKIIQQLEDIKKELMQVTQEKVGDLQAKIEELQKIVDEKVDPPKDKKNKTKKSK